MTNSIRFASNTCTDQARIDAFLTNAQTGFLGLADGEIPYVIPLNFIYYKECFFFHGAEEGRKIDIIKTNPRACFTVSESYGTLVDPVPANTDTAYMSVIANGIVERVTDLDEATSAMQEMLHKYVPNYYLSPLSKKHVATYQSSYGSKTAVFKMKPNRLTAKENEIDEQKKFYSGRTIRDDI
ncbi:pyridoxamine 5'-phosphate oxidase family protein [Bacillus massiliigorillae]|uniref:pyridoxamine 5'-phosphate oxidase family protein n=1 Tax=Bacillus massiliigorillae TaxID=1243664 RepID=UPI0003A6AE4F|nr:pyridoxamine 5'-phosphate oxidase family protein [Bacillus massiliigorillae]